MTAKLYAMLSPQGTACAETVLTGEEFTAANRARTEARYCRGGWDDPIAGTWTDVTDNEAINPAP